MRNRAWHSTTLIVMCLVASCNRVPALRPYDERTNGDVESAPIVIVGVAEGDESLGKPVNRPAHPRSTLQLHRVTVHVENVLRGNVPERTIALYYLTYTNLNTGNLPLIFGTAPSRRMIVMRKDNGVYRAAMDGRNCAPRIVTGAHPGYKPAPTASLDQYQIELNMTRGEGPLNSADFVAEIKGWLGVPGLDDITIEKLEHLALTESGTIKSAACSGLGIYSEWKIKESLRAQARDSIRTAGCKCGGTGVSLVCQ